MEQIAKFSVHILGKFIRDVTEGVERWVRAFGNVSCSLIEEHWAFKIVNVKFCLNFFHSCFSTLPKKFSEKSFKMFKLEARTKADSIKILINVKNSKILEKIEIASALKKILH